jgi:hypothetical protein
MRYLGEDELTQAMGIGYPGEIRQGPDGNLYQWVEGVDGLGNPIGFWRVLRRIGRGLRRFVRRALPIARFVAPFIPGVGPAVAAGLRVATPLLRRAGLAGYNGLGALYEARDGTLYEVQGLNENEELRGLAEEEELRGLSEDELTQVMGIGYPGEVRQGPDGNLYQWVEGVDGLGNPISFWKILRRIGRGLRRFVRGALPIARFVAPFIPGVGPAVAAGLRVATPLLRRAGLAGYNGLGALYEAPDGTLYQVGGLSEEEELRSLGEDEELRGFAEDEELRDLSEGEELLGLSEDEELRGLAEDEELRGFAEDEELRGLAEEEELRGLNQGYVREEGVDGLEAYVPDQPAGTRWFVPPVRSPEMWRPLW